MVRDMLRTIIVTEDQQYMGQRPRRAGRFSIPAGTILEVRETDSVYLVVAPEPLAGVGVPLSMALALPSFEDRTVLQILDSYRRAHLEAITAEPLGVAQQALAYLNRTAEQAIVEAVKAGLYFQPAGKADDANQPDVHVNVQPEAYVQVKIRGTSLDTVLVLQARFGHVLTVREIVQAALNLYEMHTNEPELVAHMGEALEG